MASPAANSRFTGPFSQPIDRFNRPA